MVSISPDDCNPSLVYHELGNRAIGAVADQYLLLVYCYVVKKQYDYMLIP
jgi:hypothetical protein